jgi:serine/threonine protein kinase
MRIADYEYSEKIGQGAFGIVYKGKNIITGEKVVVKTEPYHVQFSSLKHESTIMNIMYGKSCRCIPPTYWYGIDPVLSLRVLVMPFYDESLDTFITERTQRSRAGSLEVMNNIMRSAISVLDHIHSRYVVHRDIKPQNFMINDGDLYIIDFGLSTIYIDENNEHVKKIDSEHIIGTPKYVSYFTE